MGVRGAIHPPVETGGFLADANHKLFGQYIENREYDIDEGKVSAYQEVLDYIKKLEEWTCQKKRKL